jgi:hypothetical protein
MANRRARADKSWFDHTQKIFICDEVLDILPAEELFWCKLYVLQRDHCDWPDILNLLYAAGSSFDWPRLLSRMGKMDFPLLKSALTLFSWLCPSRIAQFPLSIRKQFDLKAVLIPREEEHRRLKLLDSRAWFAPLLPENVPLQV